VNPLAERGVDSGDLYTWGSNYFGQLGLGDRVMRPTPTLMPYWRDENGTTVDRNILDIAAGRHHTYAATTCEGGGFEPAVNGSTTCLCRFGWKGMACSISEAAMAPPELTANVQSALTSSVLGGSVGPATESEHSIWKTGAQALVMSATTATTMERVSAVAGTKDSTAPSHAPQHRTVTLPMA